MAVKIRLARVGTRNRPYYRIVVADTRSPRDGKFIELVGTYDPRTAPPRITVKRDRIDHWMGHGATASLTVGQLLKAAGKAEAEVAAEAQ